jgi:hypothetical protein
MLEQLTSTQILFGTGILLGVSFAVLAALNGDVSPRSQSRRRRVPGSGMLDAIGLAHLDDGVPGIADIGANPQADFFRTNRRELRARSKAA